MATALFAVITAGPGAVWFTLFFAELVLWAECQERREQCGGLETGALSQSHNLFHSSVQLTLLNSREINPGQAIGRLAISIIYIL